jgi:alpha-tubulin suppressor-like RCC1 family protein
VGVRARSISAAGEVTCAILDDNRVACWGQGTMGQMGTRKGLDECTVTRELCARIPHVVDGIDRVVQLAVGQWHVCALRDDGSVWCWGANNDGQLGVGEAPTRTCEREYPCIPRPTQVVGVRAREIAAGPFHTCALTTHGAVTCWGRDDDGQLGGPAATDRCKFILGTIPCSRVPRPIESLSGVQHLWPGATCATTINGVTSCWGSDIYHQLGTNAAPGDRCDHEGEPSWPLHFDTACARAPVPLALSGALRSMAANGATSCAELEDASVVCWGANGAGQAGLQKQPPTLCEFLPNQKEPCVASPQVALVFPLR